MINALFEMLIKRSRQSEPPVPSIPTDYVFYAPFQSDLVDVARNVTLDVKGSGASGVTHLVVDGVACTYLPSLAYACTYDVTGINAGTNPVTMSIWAKMSDPSTFDGAIFNYGKNAYGNSCWLEIGRQQSSNKWFASLPTKNYFSTVSSTAGWHHLVMQWDGQYIYMYIDGEFDGKLDRSGASITAQWIAFGANIDSTAYNSQNYYVAAARIYNRILTADEIALLAGEFTPVQTVQFAGGSKTFISGIAGSLQLTAVPSDCTFATSDVLPAGVTLSSSGLLAYDGTTISQDDTVGITVTASKAGWTSASATVTMTLKAQSGTIPEDYIWYTPYTTDYTEQVNGYTATAGQPAAFSIATDDSKFGSGYLQVCKTTMDNTGLEYGNTAGKIDLSAGNITISLWLRAPNWAQYSQICLGNRPSDSGNGFILFEDFSSNPSLDFRSRTNTSRKSTYVNVDDQWHNWVFTRTSAGAWAWHKDGLPDTSGTGDTGSIMGTGQNYKVGGGTNWTKQAYFDLSHVRIYSRVLTGDEIIALAGEFDDTSDSSSSGGSDSSSSSGGSAPTDYVFRAPLQTSLDDVSASARTATESGGSATVGEVKDGVACTYIPQAVRLLYPIGNVNTGSGDRTFSFWFLTSTYASWGSLMTVGQNSSKAMFCIGTRTSSCLPVFSANGADLEPSSPSLKDGAWHHICATLSGMLVSLYVDGTLLGTKTITGLNTSQTDICIGGRPNVTSDIAQNAWYADARIYNRALTASEVAALASHIN